MIDCMQVLSVANARCDGSIEFTSQKNKQVSISAPGMAILSSVPRWMGTVRGHISTSAQVTSGAKSRMAGWLPNGFLVSVTIRSVLRFVSTAHQCGPGKGQQRW